MATGDWTDTENDLVVSNYFAMLQKELSARPYKKIEYNRKLQELTSRSKGSIEYKLQNVSAVLQLLGEMWIPGYKPALHFQDSLLQAVERWLDTNIDRMDRFQERSLDTGTSVPRTLWIGPPPSHSNEPPPQALEKVTPILRKFDRPGRDEQNLALGLAGEKLVLDHERTCLVDAGRPDLAEKIRWVSQREGDGAGYDIASYSPKGQNRLIEVKTTCGWERTPFYLSRNEIEVSESHCNEWCLFRLWNFARVPRAFELRPPLEAHVKLTPINHLASFC